MYLFHHNPMNNDTTGEVSTHVFEAHAALLMSVMRDQAGTLAKAILEGAMNSIDAGATRIDIRATATHVEITDNGKGFGSQEEILACFKIFGLPQDQQEKMSKTYGHFRMGRGQMFHYGPNVWRTNAYAMHTDLDHRGLEFDVLSGIEPRQPGCRIEIELYKRHRMLPNELGELEREIARTLKFAPAEIRMNGRLVSRDPASEEWDIVTDDAWIRIRESGQLEIYNQGVFVEAKSPRELGTAGVVVSRSRLKVNFARNMVMASECAVWKRVRALIREATDMRIRTRKERLTDAQRDMLAGRIAAGERVVGAAELQLVTDVNKIDWTVKRIVSHCARHHIVQMLVAPGSDRRGEVLQQEGRAFVVHPTTLERFGCDTIDDFLGLLRDTGLWPGRVPIPRAGTFDEPSLAVTTDFRIIPPDQVTPMERVMLDLIQREHRWGLLREGFGRDPVRERQIRLGESSHAQAWTDGSGYIAIDRKVLWRLDTLDGWMQLSLLLASQYCAEVDTAGAFEHGGEYYLRFYEMATTRCPGFAAHAAAEFPGRLRELGRTVSKRILVMETRSAALERDWAEAQQALDAEDAARSRLDSAIEVSRGEPAQLSLPPAEIDGKAN